MDLTEGSSDTDSSTTSITNQRLGVCEVCNFLYAKYTCPKCEVKTCCLKCLQIHKKELNCTGIRDRTKYIPLNKITKNDFQNDYNFLEECTRFVETRKRDVNKKFTRYNKNLPSFLFHLRNAAKERKIKLKFLLDNFTKRNINKTYFETKNKIIFWRIEWIFSNADNCKFVDDYCNENEILAKLLDKYINPKSDVEVPLKKCLEFYQCRGFGDIRLLLKAEGIKNSCNRLYELDSNKSVKANLSNKTIVEFPTIFVVYNVLNYMYDIIDSDEDVEADTKMYQDSLDELGKSNKNRGESDKVDEEVRENMERLKIAKKQAERQKRRIEREKEPTNLLFTDESMWDDLSTDTDDGNVTEEEGKSSSKRLKVEKMII